MPGLTETKYIEIAQEDSIQLLPSVPKGTANQRLFFSSTYRGPLLPAHGTRIRERSLLEWYWNDFNIIYRSAIAGLIKRIQSTPWEIQGKEPKEPDLVEIYQGVLLSADFGNGWSSFLSKLLLDYSRSDGGGYIELIGPGDPTKPLVTGITGLSILDSLRCVPTGDPEFPVIYMDSEGAMHDMHHTRIVRFVDTPDSYEAARGYGECSLSRAISTVARDIRMNRYIDQTLDDNPPPGIVIFKNITDKVMQNGIEQMHRDRETDTQGVWGRSIRLNGLHTDQMPEIEFISYTTPPDKFDFEKYKNLNVKEIALAIGLDVQDIWELTGGAIGTATQSEILHQKSKGRAIGRILKELERVLNQALPESLTFEFQYQDPDEDQDQATLAQTWIGNAAQMQTMGAKPETLMQLLANQVPAIRDVVTDEEGQLRLPDVAMTPEEAGVVVPDVDDMVAPDASIEEDKEKALADTQREFRNGIIAIAKSVKISTPSQLRTDMRINLQQLGEKAAKDGLIAGGAEPVISKKLKRSISQWRTSQTPFINKFVEALLNTEQTQSQIANRADMWVNRTLNPVYFMGLAEADDVQKYMWVVDPKKEHCNTCLRLNGQIHRMKAFIKSGFMPHSRSLDCKGYKCGCELKKSDNKARGRIPTGGGGSALQNIANAIGRVFGGG